jgi:hypothetical protein
VLIFSFPFQKLFLHPAARFYVLCCQT